MADGPSLWLILAFGEVVFIFLGAYLFSRSRNRKASLVVHDSTAPVPDLPKSRRQKKAEGQGPPVDEGPIVTPKGPSQEELESAARRAGISFNSIERWVAEKKKTASKDTSLRDLYRILQDLEQSGERKNDALT